MLNMKFLVILLASILFAGCGPDGETVEEVLGKAQEYQQKGELNASVIEYKNAIRLAPERSDLRFSLGQIYSDRGDFQSALKEFSKAIQLDPNSANILVALARVQMELEEYEEVTNNLNPEKGSTDEQKAQLYAFLGLAQALLNQPNAIDSLKRAQSLDDQNSDVRLAWGKYEGLRGNIAEQKDWLEPLLKNGEGHPDAWSQIGVIEQRGQNFEAAIGAYTHSINQRNYLHPDLMKRAMVFIEISQLDKAQADVDTLLKAKVPWVGAPHIAGIISLQQKNWIKARDYFQKVLSSKPDYAPSQLFLAIIDARENNLQNALSLMEQYIDRIPNNTRANLFYVDLLIRLNKLHKAQSELKNLYQVNKDDPRILVLFGRSFLKQNNIGQAVEYFNRSIALNPNDPVARVLLGNALISKAETRELGRSELEKALQLDPAISEAYLSLFESYLQDKNYGLAGSISERVNKQFPESSQGANMSALLLLRRDEPEKAIEILKSTLERFPKDGRTTENLAKIYLWRQDYASAKKLFTDTLLYDPGNLKALIQLAFIAKREGDFQKSLDWLKQAADKNRDQIAPKLALAAEYIELGQPKQADQILSPEEFKHGNSAAYRLVRAQAKIALKEYANARTMLESVLDELPGSVTAQLLMAKIYANTKEPTKLREALEKVLELDPENFSGLLAFARLELIEGNLDRFRQKLMVLKSNYANHPDVLWLQAKLDTGNQDYRGAVVTLSDLMRKIPNSAVVKELARNQWAAGKRDEAIAELEAWLVKNPDDVNALGDLAEYFALEKRENDSLDVYQKLNKLAPSNPIILNNLAWLLRDIDTKKALEFALKAAELEPQDADIMDTVAVIYLRDNQPGNAKIYSQGAYRLKPGSDFVQLHHAKILIANQDFKAAQRILLRLNDKTDSEEIKREVGLELEKLK